jgi:hypothetical protein
MFSLDKFIKRLIILRSSFPNLELRASYIFTKPGWNNYHFQNASEGKVGRLVGHNSVVHSLYSTHCLKMLVHFPKNYGRNPMFADYWRTLSKADI